HARHARPAPVRRGEERTACRRQPRIEGLPRQTPDVRRPALAHQPAHSHLRVTESTPALAERQTWLYTREEGSICIVRVRLGYGRMRLLIRGPGYLVTDLQFPDHAACIAHQADVERT